MSANSRWDLIQGLKG